jgi:transglutaminase-like putative cysteine protease
MTAIAATRPGAVTGGRLSQLLAGPTEGWTALAGVVGMVLALAWSFDDAQWVTGIGNRASFLPQVAFAGVAIGFIGPKLGWSRWSTHLIGIAFAAIILPVIAGSIVLGDAVTGFSPAVLAARYHASAEVITRVWLDLAIKGLPRTTEYGHYFIAEGAILWAAGQYAAYAVFGHRRSLDPVIVLGLILLANMAVTSNDQLHLMVLFSMAALILLARSHAFEEQTTWLRRRIGDPAAVTSLYLRGGAIFISGAVLGSLFLTATASSAPLQGLWRDLPGSLVEFSQWIQRYVSTGANTRNPGIVVFGSQTLITGSWSQSDAVAFVAQLPASETERFKWRVGTYAEFDLNAWSWGSTTEIARDGRTDLLPTSADDATKLLGRRDVLAEISVDRLPTKYVVSPETIRWVDQPSTVRVVGSEHWLATVETGGSKTYTVDALVPIIGETPGAITENRLRVASRDYTADVKRLYLAVPDGALGPRSRKILADVLAATPDQNPYDIALNLQNYLLDDNVFHYDTDVTDEVAASCSGLSTVECFATIKRGYCQFYASTMAILLREAGIPTRLAQGFLPGTRSADGREVVSNLGAHAWVEVFFPGYGWVPFDPTGGGVGQQEVIEQGPIETATPRPSARVVTDNPNDTGDANGPSRDPTGATGGTGGRKGSSPGPFIAIALLLGIGALGVGSIAWRRGPRPIHPDRAWGSVARWAARVGLAPRPSQTVYEFAGTLGDAIPAVRPELTTVANAKVEIAYGRRELGADRMSSVAQAHRRIRIGLLRLALRRPGWLRRRPRRRR